MVLRLAARPSVGHVSCFGSASQFASPTSKKRSTTTCRRCVAPVLRPRTSKVAASALESPTIRGTAPASPSAGVRASPERMSVVSTSRRQRSRSPRPPLESVAFSASHSEGSTTSLRRCSHRPRDSRGCVVGMAIEGRLLAPPTQLLPPQVAVPLAGDRLQLTCQCRHHASCR